MGGFGSVFFFYILILIYFFEYEIIVRTSAWSFVIQILIQAVCFIFDHELPIKDQRKRTGKDLHINMQWLFILSAT